MQRVAVVRKDRKQVEVYDVPEQYLDAINEAIDDPDDADPGAQVFENGHRVFVSNVSILVLQD